MNPASLDRIVATALDEDIGTGDITSEAVVVAGTWASADILAREEGVLAGIPIGQRVFMQVDPALEFKALCQDGDRIHDGEIIARVSGNARSIVIAERTVLNFMQRLCGIATMVARYVDACSGTRARIVDTRKTVPGLRSLDKYAVRMGGGANHRCGLFDGILIKENHIRSAGGIASAVQSARDRAPHTMRVEIECETLTEVEESIQAGADIILLDNMTMEQMRQAVDCVGSRAMVEASGNMTLDRIPEVARLGVDFISVGALTHSVHALDMSLQITSWRVPGERSV